MSSTATPVNRPRFVTTGSTLIHIDFLLIGIVMTFLGPMLPTLEARWSLSDVRAGYLIFAEFFSSMFGMLASGLMVGRIGYRLTLILALALMSAGMVMLAFGPFWLGIVSVCVFGIGYGITSPAGNLRTAETHPQRSAAALNLINAVWGLGAMSSPFLVAAAERAHRISWFFYGTAAALMALLLAMSLARFVPDNQVRIRRSDAGVRRWRSPMLPLVGTLFFLYVGTETSFGAWVATFARRMEPGQQAFWAMTPSFFWGALLAGRVLAPFALRFATETAVARGGLTSALIGGAVIYFAHSLSAILAGSIFAGLGLASVFPISVSLFPNWFGTSARSLSGAVFACGNIGGAVLPWIVGAISTRYHDLRTGFLVPLAGVAAMLAFYLATRPPALARAASES
jgi:FHS family glucose/mannose:H+ symporter-like MFS transporter